MNNITLVPTSVLKMLLPIRAAGGTETSQQWEGGTIRCRATGGQLATKGDLSIIERATIDRDARILQTSGALRKSHAIEALDRCVRTTLVVETPERTDSFPLIAAYQDSQQAGKIEIQMLAEIVRIVAALAARS